MRLPAGGVGGVSIVVNARRRAGSMSEDARKQLGKRLRQAREHLGLSQDAVALELGLSRPAVSQIEHANRRVDVIELMKLAELYRRPMSYFTGEQPVGEPPQIELLKRAATELSDHDRDEVLRFAELLRARSRSAATK